MVLEKCRKCGNAPEILYRVGYTFGAMKEARAQIKCIACGNAGRPRLGRSGRRTQRAINRDGRGLLE